MDPSRTDLPIDNVRTLPFKASIPPKSESSFFERLWKRVCDVVRSIFKGFASLFTSREFFSTREITLLRDERTPKALPVTPLPIRKVTVEKPEDISDLPSTKPICNPDPVYNTFDKPLEDLREFTRDFAGLSVDVIYENQMVESLKSAQAFAPSLPPLIKSMATLLVEMGDKAAKPLFKKFAAQKSQIIEPALKKIFKTLTKPNQNELREKLSIHLEGWLANKITEGSVNASDYINPLLNWISTPEDQRKPLADLYSNKKYDQKLVLELAGVAQKDWDVQVEAKKKELHLSLSDQLSSEFKEAKIPFMHNIDEDFILPILDWLLNSNQSEPLVASFRNMTEPKEKLIDDIFERVISLLVEKKIDQYSKYLETTLQRDLGDIVLQMMKKNATRMTNFFTERTSELITNMQFTQTFDSLIHETLTQQIQAIIASEAAYEEEKKVLAKAVVYAQLAPTSPEGRAAQQQAEKHLNTVEMYGGKEAYLHYMRLESFSKHAACNPQLKHIIDQEMQLTQRGQDPSIDRKAGEKAIYAAIAENLLNLMTPARKTIGKNGKVEETDPFVELWDLIYLPEEFQNLIKQSEELTHEFVTPDTTALLEKIRQPLVEIAKNLFKTTAKDMLKKQIGEMVQKGFEKIVIPANINEINADSTLPNINLALVETFSKQELARNLNNFAPAFYQLVTLNKEDREKQVRKIQKSLTELTKSKFNQFNPEEFYSKETDTENVPEMEISGLTPMDWHTLTQSIILEIEQSILQSKIDGSAFDPETTTHAEIKDILKVTFSSTSKENNPLFGKLSMDVIFKLGNLENGEWGMEKFVKDTISQSITESVKPWRESHDKMINTATQALRSSYSDKQSVKSLLTDAAKKPSVHTGRKLAHQINVMSRLSHDIIMGLAQEKGIIAHFATRQIISDSPDKLNRVITTLYKKMFSDQLINQNLAANACDKLFQSLSKASDKIRMEENMLAHQMAAIYQITLHKAEEVV